MERPQTASQREAYSSFVRVSEAVSLSGEVGACVFIYAGKEHKCVFM